MPPSTPKRRRAAPWRAAAVAAGGVVVAVAIFIGVTQIGTQKGSTRIRLGADTFDVGPAVALAQTVQRDDYPLLFQDLLIGGKRDIWVNHVGTNAVEGWVAFEARTEGSERKCNTTWSRQTHLFTDPCTGTTYPPDGGGLRHYDVTINAKSHVVVDLTPNGLPGGGTTVPTVAPTSTTIPRFGVTSTAAAS